MPSVVTMQALADVIAAENEAADRLIAIANQADDQGDPAVGGATREIARAHRAKAIELRARLDTLCFFYTSGHAPDPC